MSKFSTGFTLGVSRDQYVKLQGLIPDASYRLEGDDQTYSGASLMYGGISFPLTWDDYPAHQLYFTRI